jgi:hypothetical protein
MFSFLKNDKITNAVTKMNVIPHPQWPSTNKYVLKNKVNAAIAQRIINRVIVKL